MLLGSNIHIGNTSRRQSSSPFQTLVGGAEIVGDEIVATNVATGTRGSMFIGGTDRAANTVDSFTVGGIPFIGVAGAVTQIADPVMTNWFDFGIGATTDLGDGVYEITLNPSDGDKQTLDGIALNVSDNFTAGSQIKLISGSAADLVFRSVRVDTFAVTKECPLSDITTSWSEFQISDVAAHTEHRIIFFAPNGTSSVTFQVKQMRCTKTSRLMPYATTTAGADDITCTPTFGSAGTLFVAELPYHWSRDENPFGGQYALHTTNLFSAQSGENINVLGSGFSPNIDTGGRLLSNKLSTFTLDWDGVDIGARFGTATRQTDTEADTPSGTLQIGNQPNQSSNASARIAILKFDRVITDTENAILYNGFRSLASTLEDTKTSVACYGDSMTQGFGATAGEDWPNILERDYVGYTHNNEGISGQTPQQFTDRYIADEWSHDYDALVLWEAGDNGGTIGEQIDYFNDAIAQCNGAYLVIGRCTTGDESTNNATLLAEYGADNFLDIKDVLVTESGQPNYDMYRSDSIHLNDAGYAIVAREVASKLDSIIAE